MNSTPLSLVVTTFNNADTLARCLSSAAGLVDEIVVLDSFSEDNTLSIAAEFNAHTSQQAFAGFGPQKQAAIDLASHDWVLLLDADEAVSDELVAEVERLKASGFQGAGYRIKRREWLADKTPIEQHGRWQRHGVKLTDHLRLFDRRCIRFTEHAVHAAPVAETATPLLKHEFLHWGDAPFSRRLEKARHYAQLTRSQSAVSPLKRYVSPAWAFVQDYFLRRYFLDGALGFKAAACSFWASWWKYRPPPKRPND